MSDPLSLASGIAGLLSLSIQILEIGTQFYSDFKHAPKSYHVYFREIKALSIVLVTLEDRLENDSIKTYLSSQPPTPSVIECYREAQELIQAFTKNGLSSISYCDRFKWHFKKADIQEAINRLQRYRAMIVDDFEGALSMRAVHDRQTLLLNNQKLFCGINTVQSKVSGLQSSADQVLSSIQNFELVNTKLNQTLQRIERTLQDNYVAPNAPVPSGRRFDPRVELVRQENSVLQWLGTTDPSWNHKFACDASQSGTGTWFFSSREYRSWTSKMGQLLWLSGIPGAGKTILCSMAIERIEVNFKDLDQKSSKIAYYYFDFRDTEKQTQENLIYALIRQLSLGSIHDSVISLYRRHAPSGARPASSKLLDCLEAVISSLDRVIIILDALDEANEVVKILDVFVGLARRFHNKINIILSSRQTYDVALQLAPAADITIPVFIGDRSAEDIRKFVDEQLRRDPVLRTRRDQWHDIEQVLYTSAQGMFRLVSCQIDSLRHCRTKQELKNSLNSLPASLEETYERALVQVREGDRPMTYAALQWLIYHTIEPQCFEIGRSDQQHKNLTIAQLAQAAVVPSDRVFDPNLDCLFDVREVLSITATLVTTYEVQGTEYVQLAHKSVHEYLVSERIRKSLAASFYLSDTLAHHNIALACLQYLLSVLPGCVFERDSRFLLKQDPAHNYNSQYPLLKYCALKWMYHFQISSFEDRVNCKLQSLALKFLLQEREAFKNWCEMIAKSYFRFLVRTDSGLPSQHTRSGRWERDMSWARGMKPLHIAIFSGDLRLVRLLVSEKHSINDKDSPGFTPLQVAVAAGHPLIVDYLLGQGADIRSHSAPGVLSFASINGDAGMIKKLLQCGAVPTTLELIQAARHGQPDAARILIEAGASVISHYPRVVYDLEDATALHVAALAGEGEMIGVLVRNGAELESTCIYGRSALLRGPQNLVEATALHVAVEEGMEEAVQRLLYHGATTTVLSSSLSSTVNSTSSEPSPVLTAARNKSYGIVNLLLKAGADPNTMIKSSLGARKLVELSAFHEACLQADDALIGMMLQSGANPNVRYRATYGRDVRVDETSLGLLFLREFQRRNEHLRGLMFLEVARHGASPFVDSSELDVGPPLLRLGLWVDLPCWTTGFPTYKWRVTGLGYQFRADADEDYDGRTGAVAYDNLLADTNITREVRNWIRFRVEELCGDWNQQYRFGNALYHARHQGYLANARLMLAQGALEIPTAPYWIPWSETALVADNNEEEEEEEDTRPLYRC